MKDDYKVKIISKKLGYQTTESLLDLGYKKKQLEISQASKDSDYDERFIRVYDQKKLTIGKDETGNVKKQKEK